MTGFSPSTVTARPAACPWPSSTCAAIPTAIPSRFTSTAAASGLTVSSRDVLGGNPERARDGIRRGGHVQHGASVDDGERLVTDVETTLELLGRDLRDPETTEKPLALDELDAHVGGERRPDDDEEHVAEASGP